MKNIMKKKSNIATNKKSGGKILTGTLVGAALGVVAGMLLSPKSGKEMRNDVSKLPADFYRYIAPKIKKMKQVSEAQYHSLVEKGVQQYATAKRLTLDEGKMLLLEAKRSWNHMKRHLG